VRVKPCRIERVYRFSALDKVRDINTILIGYSKDNKEIQLELKNKLRKYEPEQIRKFPKTEFMYKTSKINEDLSMD
jgi:hypothetical protein